MDRTIQCSKLFLPSHGWKSASFQELRNWGEGDIIGQLKKHQVCCSIEVWLFFFPLNKTLLAIFINFQSSKLLDFDFYFLLVLLLLLWKRFLPPLMD